MEKRTTFFLAVLTATTPFGDARSAAARDLECLRSPVSPREFQNCGRTSFPAQNPQRPYDIVAGATFWTGRAELSWDCANYYYNCRIDFRSFDGRMCSSMIVIQLCGGATF